MSSNLYMFPFQVRVASSTSISKIRNNLQEKFLNMNVEIVCFAVELVSSRIPHCYPCTALPFFSFMATWCFIHESDISRCCDLHLCIL